jgi:hypothetical protein
LGVEHDLEKWVFRLSEEIMRDEKSGRYCVRALSSSGMSLAALGCGRDCR